MVADLLARRAASANIAFAQKHDYFHINRGLKPLDSQPGQEQYSFHRRRNPLEGESKQGEIDENRQRESAETGNGDQREPATEFSENRQRGSTKTGNGNQQAARQLEV